jgi:TRAP-type C4-dicarboxylate transport system permease small subunit
LRRLTRYVFPAAAFTYQKGIRMISFLRIERFVFGLSEKVNWIAAAALAFIMLLTVADVVMRFFGRPIPGTYELVGFVGSMIISFALPYTSVQKGHIAVEFLTQKLPWLARVIVNVVNALISMIFFSVVAWQCILYGRILKAAGEVSLTLQMKTYPFVYGVAFGCAMLSLVLLIELLRQLRGAEIE